MLPNLIYKYLGCFSLRFVLFMSISKFLANILGQNWYFWLLLQNCNSEWFQICYTSTLRYLNILSQFPFKFGTYIIHVRIHVHDSFFHNRIKDGWLAAIFFWDMLSQFSFKFGTYIIHVRIHVHDNFFHNWIKDGRLAAILFFENVWYLGHALSVFVQIWYIHYTC